MVAPVISVQVLPLLVLTCHCTVGVGLPEAAALKVTWVPALTDLLAGWKVITGAESGIGLTVRVAAFVVAVP